MPPAEVNADWAQPGGNAAKSMGHLALGASLTRAWTVSIEGSNKRERLASPPVVADNRLFVVDTQGAVNAFAADTGSKLWSTPTVKDKENRLARFGGGVSADGGQVYATNGVGDVVAFDAATGTETWRIRPGGPLRGSPTVANGNIYVLSQDNQIFALNQATGAVLWTASASPESQGVFGVAAPASAQGTVVVGFSSGELNAYRYENGDTLWADVLSRSSISTSVSSISDIDAEPVIDQGRVFAVGQGGRMVAIDMSSGSRIWEQNIAGIATPWVAGEWLFVVTDDARAAVHRARQRQGPLDLAAQALSQPQEAEGAGQLGGPGACGRPAGAAELGRRHRLGLGQGRRAAFDRRDGRYAVAAAGGREPDALCARRQGAADGVPLIGGFLVRKRRLFTRRRGDAEKKFAARAAPFPAFVALCCR